MPSTTNLGSTTSAKTPTTLDPPVARAAIEGAPDDLVDRVAELYAWTLSTSFSAPPSLPALMVQAFRPIHSEEQAIEVEGVAHVAEVLGSQVAVVSIDADLVLAVDDGTGWRIVGAKLARFDEPAWYGGTPRLLMIIGSDARPGQNPLIFRADSLHIMGVAPDRLEGSIVGIPRDTLVTKLDGTQDKLTHAMASQSPEVLTLTVEKLTGLQLDGYIVTGFRGFMDVVNALGGFTFFVPFGVTDEKAEADFRSGTQHFNGADALAYARIRSIKGGDFTRQLNGGKLLLAMMTEAHDRGVEPLDVPGLLSVFTRFVATDLTPSQLLTMGMAVFELDPEGIHNVVLPGAVGRAVGRSVVFLDDLAFEMIEDLADGVLDEEYPPFP